MRLELPIIERVETLVRHSSFAGSDGVMEIVLEALRSRARDQPISRATYRLPCEMILNPPLFARTD
jgi:hypothetical protein